jgi:hypothetical protein
MRRLQIYIDEDMDDLIGAVARREGRSKASLIREAVLDKFGESGGSDTLDELAGFIDLEPGDIDALVYDG